MPAAPSGEHGARVFSLEAASSRGESGGRGSSQARPAAPSRRAVTSAVHPRSGSIWTRWRHGRAAWVVAACPAPQGSRCSVWPASQTTVQTPET